jgi:hypothetical protein
LLNLKIEEVNEVIPHYTPPSYNSLNLDFFLEPNWEARLPKKKIKEVKPQEDYEFGDFKIPIKALDELITLENEKFTLFHKFCNVERDTSEIIKKMLPYLLSKKDVIGDSLGLQGVGKTTFFEKHFPKELYFNCDKDFPTWYDEGIPRSNYNVKVHMKLCSQHSLLFDGMAHTINVRDNTRATKKEYCRDDYFVFLFYSDVRTCVDRVIKRCKPSGLVNEALACMIIYLTQVEVPINSHLELEEGIDLLLGINEYGKITHAFPKDKYYGIINT